MEDLRLYRKKEIKNMEKNKIAFLYIIYVCLGKGRKNLIKDKKESIKYK